MIYFTVGGVRRSLWDTYIRWKWLQSTYFCFRKINNSHICSNSGIEPTGSRHFPGSLLFFDSLFQEVFFLWVYLLSPLGKIYCFLHAVPNYRSLLIQDHYFLLAFLAAQSTWCAFGQWRSVVPWIFGALLNCSLFFSKCVPGSANLWLCCFMLITDQSSSCILPWVFCFFFPVHPVQPYLKFFSPYFHICIFSLIIYIFHRWI